MCQTTAQPKANEKTCHKYNYALNRKDAPNARKPYTKNVILRVELLKKTKENQMIEGARQLPIQHLTIRVPWHDNSWRGTFCNNPCGNTSCTILPRIAIKRDDAQETNLAGTSLEKLDRANLPPCVDEHATIMAPFALSMIKHHPYVNSAKPTHGHFAPTPYTIQPYSAAAIPFHWMLREQAEGNDKFSISSRVENLKLSYSVEREPDLGFATSWIQEGTNQRVLLDTFFSAAKPD